MLLKLKCLCSYDTRAWRWATLAFMQSCMHICILKNLQYHSYIALRRYVSGQPLWFYYKLDSVVQKFIYLNTCFAWPYYIGISPWYYMYIGEVLDEFIFLFWSLSSVLNLYSVILKWSCTAQIRIHAGN